MRKLLQTTWNAVALAALMFGTTSEGFAATDGTVGATSTGTAEINVSIPQLIKISGLADLNFGTYSGSGDLDLNENVVVAGNDSSASPTYRVTASGSGASSAFTVSNGTETLPYRVFFNDQAGIAGTTETAATTPLTNQGGIHTSLGTNTENANYRVLFAETALQNAAAGAYTGTLTLVVEPE